MARVPVQTSKPLDPDSAWMTFAQAIYWIQNRTAPPPEPRVRRSNGHGEIIDWGDPFIGGDPDDEERKRLDEAACQLRNALGRGDLIAFGETANGHVEISAIDWATRDVTPYTGLPFTAPYVELRVRRSEAVRIWPADSLIYVKADDRDPINEGSRLGVDQSSVGYDWEGARSLYDEVMTEHPGMAVKTAAREVRVSYEKHIGRPAPSPERIAVRIRQWRRGSSVR